MIRGFSEELGKWANGPSIWWDTIHHLKCISQKIAYWLGRVVKAQALEAACLEWNLVLPLTSCVTLGELFNLSVM